MDVQRYLAVQEYYVIRAVLLRVITEGRRQGNGASWVCKNRHSGTERQTCAMTMQ